MKTLAVVALLLSSSSAMRLYDNAPPKAQAQPATTVAAPPANPVKATASFASVKARNDGNYAPTVGNTAESINVTPVAEMAPSTPPPPPAVPLTGGPDAPHFDTNGLPTTTVGTTAPGTAANPIPLTTSDPHAPPLDPNGLPTTTVGTTAPFFDPNASGPIAPPLDQNDEPLIPTGSTVNSNAPSPTEDAQAEAETNAAADAVGSDESEGDTDENTDSDDTDDSEEEDAQATSGQLGSPAGFS